MEKIDSFKVDHTKLLPGLYVSRVDYIGNEVVTTFDLRICKPNIDSMNPSVAHTLEHIIATLLRNYPSFKEKVIYFGPMGCLTGFYLIVKGGMTPLDVIKTLIDAFGGASQWDSEIPGVSMKECGNHTLHNLAGAKAIAKGYADLLTEIYHGDIYGRTEYPKPTMLVLFSMDEEMQKFSRSVPRFILDNYSLFFRVTGIGKVNAAMSAQNAIMETNPDIVLNYGFCGAFAHGGFKVGQGVSVDGAVYNDVWCGTGRYGQVQGLPYMFETVKLSDDEMSDFVKAGLCESVAVKSKSMASVSYPSREVILTGDKFVQTKEAAEEIKERFNFDTNDRYALVDMEAAAIAQVCFANNVPLSVFKVVSDIVDKYESADDHDKEYDKFKKDFK